MISTNLRKIADNIAATAAETNPDHPADPEQIRQWAVQIAAQAEMLDEGLDG